MQHGEPGQATHGATGRPSGFDGMVIMLKVVGLLAGYAIFVWTTMTQMERRYLTPQTAAADREALAQPVAVPGVVVIQSRPAATVREPAASSRGVPQPGRAETF